MTTMSSRICFEDPPHPPLSLQSRGILLNPLARAPIVLPIAMGQRGEGVGEGNSSTLFLVAALVVAADKAGAGLLGVFFHQERCAALRAGLRHGAVPEG